MKIKELQQKLQKAYSVKNLNNISLTLINLYKTRQYSILKKIAEIIRDYEIIEIMDDGKGFSKLMMLYHPDRAGFHINEIKKYAEQNDFDGMLKYSHILKLEHIEEIAVSLDNYEDIDYAPVYEWDVNADGFSIINDRVRKKNVITKKRGYTFYEAVKMREYGDIDIEFPPYYLEDFEEFELSSSEINDLDGVQFCIHAKNIDLSDNMISDITPLTGLICIEELNLSDNQIGYIDVLSNLVNLKSVQLSNNYFDDISPLFELDKLEYADLTGNKVIIEEINKLIESGVTVDY